MDCDLQFFLTAKFSLSTGGFNSGIFFEGIVCLFGEERRIHNQNGKPLDTWSLLDSDLQLHLKPLSTYLCHTFLHVALMHDGGDSITDRS